MNQLETICIGFGNKSGQTVNILLEEQKSRIQITNLKATHVEAPKIKIKHYQSSGLGILKECVEKKRDEFILKELLKVNIDCNPDQIMLSCQQIENKIENDLVILGAMMEDTKIDKFMEKAKCNQAVARKYLEQNDNNIEGAIKQYRQHQQMIKKFMEQQKCDILAATSFLEANNYESQILE